MLRAWVPEVAFHDHAKPIFSLDSHSSGRFFTAGGHPHVRVWRWDVSQRNEEGMPKVDFRSQLPSVGGSRKAINTIRVSPCGDFLAAAGDGCHVTLFSLRPWPLVVPLPPLFAAEDQAEGSGGDRKKADLPPSFSDRPHPDPLHSTPGLRVPEYKEPESAAAEKEEKLDEELKEPRPPSPLPSSPSKPSLPIGENAEDDVSDLIAERYRSLRVLVGHRHEVFTLAFSPTSARLVSGDLDGVVLMWDRETGRVVQQFRHHSGFVQGVAWDPLDAYFVTLSSDRTAQVYSRVGQRGGSAQDWRLTRTIHSVKLESLFTTVPWPWVQPAQPVVSDVRPFSSSSSSPTSSFSASPNPAPGYALLFLGDWVESFFRRPAWSPCGRILLLPCGLVKREGKMEFCTWMFHRDDLGTPAGCLPHAKPSIACAFSPFAYEMPPPPSPSLCHLAGLTQVPVQLLFCVATAVAVMIYSTARFVPIGIISNMQQATVTDIVWCKGDVTDTTDRVLVSSSDGYVTIIEIEDVAVKLTGDELAQWKADIDKHREEARKSWQPVDQPSPQRSKLGRRRKSEGSPSPDSPVAASPATSPAAKTVVTESKGCEGKEEKVKVDEQLTSETPPSAKAKDRKARAASDSVKSMRKLDSYFSMSTSSLLTPPTSTRATAPQMKAGTAATSSSPSSPSSPSSSSTPSSRGSSGHSASTATSASMISPPAGHRVKRRVVPTLVDDDGRPITEAVGGGMALPQTAGGDVQAGQTVQQESGEKGRRKRKLTPSRLPTSPLRPIPIPPWSPPLAVASSSSSFIDLTSDDSVAAATDAVPTPLTVPSRATPPSQGRVPDVSEKSSRASLPWRRYLCDDPVVTSLEELSGGPRIRPVPVTWPAQPDPLSTVGETDGGGLAQCVGGEWEEGMDERVSVQRGIRRADGERAREVREVDLV